MFYYVGPDISGLLNCICVVYILYIQICRAASFLLKILRYKVVYISCSNNKSVGYEQGPSITKYRCGYCKLVPLSLRVGEIWMCMLCYCLTNIEMLEYN